MRFLALVFILLSPFVLIPHTAKADNMLLLPADEFLQECQNYPNACGTKLVGYRIELADGGDICVANPFDGMVLQKRVVEGLRLSPELREKSALDAIKLIVAEDLNCS